MAELRRALGPIDATMVNVGVMIGSAVFLTASEVASRASSPIRSGNSAPGPSQPSSRSPARSPSRN